MKMILGFLLSIALFGCGEFQDAQKTSTKLIYFGFDDRSEKQQDAIALAKTWSHAGPCPHWRATVNRQDADFQVLFGDSETLTILDHRGQILYSGGEGVLYLPHGNSDGTGTNICKLTGE